VGTARAVVVALVVALVARVARTMGAAAVATAVEVLWAEIYSSSSLSNKSSP
jgi:hypothetical protein